MAVTTPPLSLGEILDRTVQLYRRNFMLFVGISFLPAALDVLVSGGVSIFFTSRAAALQTPAGSQTILVFGLVVLLFILVGIPLLLAVFSLSLSALNQAAFQRNRGETITVRAAYAYGLRHFWRYLGILFLQFLFAAVIPGAVFGGIISIGAMITALVATTGMGRPLAVLFGLLLFLFAVALIVVAVWIWLRYCLAFPVCVTEEKKVWPCMQRSAQLSKGSRGRIFVMYALVFVLTIIVAYALTIPLDIILKLTVYKSMATLTLFTKPPLMLQVINLFISFLERSFVMPIYAIALVIFYNDQRTRQEGYDIELLMAQAGWSELAPPPTVAAPAFTAALPIALQSQLPPEPAAAAPPIEPPPSPALPEAIAGSAHEDAPTPGHPEVTGA